MPRALKARVVVDYGAGEVRRFCAACGADISHRNFQAVYCAEGTVCARRRAAERTARERREHPERVRARERAWYRRMLARDPGRRERRTEAARRRIEPYRDEYLATQREKQRERRRRGREAAGARA